MNNPQTEPVGKRRTGRLILIGVLSYLLFLLANLPAAVAWQMATKLTTLPVQLSQLRGTLWSGSAGSVTIPGKRPLVLPNLTWQLDGSHRILLGKLPLSVHLGNPDDIIEVEGSLLLSPGTLEINNAKLATTAQWLLDAIDAPIPAKVSGQVDLTLNRLAVTTQGCSAISGKVRLDNIQLRSLLGSLTIGDISASLGCKNRALLASVDQTSTDMTSEGTFTLDSQGSYRFEGKTQTNSKTPTAVTRALALITNENAGIWPLQFQGKLY